MCQVHHLTPANPLLAFVGLVFIFLSFIFTANTNMVFFSPLRAAVFHHVQHVSKLHRFQKHVTSLER